MGGGCCLPACLFGGREEMGESYQNALEGQERGRSKVDV